MQLKSMKNKSQTKTTSVREKLALATCALLQTASTSAQAADEWEIDSALMIYSENDSRVTAIEPIVTARKEVEEDKFFNVKLVLDSLTGATPNGAHTSSTLQTFTKPSGTGGYTVAAGENPLDDTFHDTRVALSADWEQPVLDNYSRMIIGGNLSKEFDYMSLGASATFMRDYNDRNTTLTTALGVNADTISPVGDVPTPFANMMVAGSGTNRDAASDNKTITDFMIGVTQVIDRKTLMQFNLSLSSASGYMNDPYKVITVVDTAGARIAQAGNDLPYVYENRPDSRSRQVFYWKTVHHLTEDVINVSYRYHTDDWDITSHTVDLNYRYELSGGAYLQPHIRYYTQSAAEFFTHNILDTQVGVAQYASSDYRLGELNTTTIGLKYAMPMKNNQEFSMRVESIVQSYSTVSSTIGTLNGDAGSQDIVPDLGAFVIQVGYSFYW